MTPPHDDRKPLGVLLRDLADGSAQLVRSEVRLARIELTSMVTGLGVGTAEIVSGAMLALLGTMALFTGLIMLAGDQWLRDRYWLAALIVTVILGALAFWLAKKGMGLLSPKQLAPDQTVETLREDKEWLKQRLTSGAT